MVMRRVLLREQRNSVLVLYQSDSRRGMASLRKTPGARSVRNWQRPGADGTMPRPAGWARPLLRVKDDVMPRSLRASETKSNPLHSFVNRTTQLDALQSVLHLPAGKPLPVLVFCGVGGSGKSWLLHKLRTTLPADFPAALIDLEPASGGTPYHTD